MRQDEVRLASNGEGGSVNDIMEAFRQHRYVVNGE